MPVKKPRHEPQNEEPQPLVEATLDSSVDMCTSAGPTIFTDVPTLALVVPSPTLAGAAYCIPAVSIDLRTFPSYGSINYLCSASRLQHSLRSLVLHQPSRLSLPTRLSSAPHGV